MYSFSSGMDIPELEMKICPEYLLISKKSENVTLLQQILTKDTVNSRLSKGDLCMSAIFNNRVVSYCWLCFDKIDVAEVNKEVRVKNDEIYLYDAFTREKFRSLNLFSQILTHIAKYAFENGYKRLIIFSLKKNISSRKAITKAGFFLFKKVKFITILGVSFKFQKIFNYNEPDIELY